MKIPSACSVVIVLAGVAVVVRGFSVNTIARPAASTSPSGIVGPPRTELFGAGETSGEDASAPYREELVRREMLAARLQKNNHIEPIPTAETEEEPDEEEDSQAVAVAEEEGTDDEKEPETISEKEEKDTQEGEEPEGVSSAEEVDSEGATSEEPTDNEDETESILSEADPTEKDAAVEVEENKDEGKGIDALEPYYANTFSITNPPFDKDAPRAGSKASGKGNDDGGVKLEVVANVAASIAKEVAADLLSFIRFGAANLLTSSLPETQREELLRRMGAQMLPPGTTATTIETTAEPEDARASINEEIALARAEEAQASEKKWEREKEDIVRQMEDAANARVEDELKIQQMKLEKEQREALKAKETELEEERKRFLLLEEERKKEKEFLANEVPDGGAEVSDLFVAKKKEAEEQNKEVEELLEKRKKQKAVLDTIEEELRVSVANEAEERERLNSLLEKRKEQQSELSIVEENLRVQVVEIEAEKVQYKELVAELEVLKEQEQIMKQESPTAQESSEATPGEDTDSEDSEDSEEDIVHPVLGPVVADLGYKRIHFVSAGRLSNIPVWNRNRIYRNNRAKSMATEKIKSMELGFPGAICLHETASGKLSIVDGQHRVGMMAALKTTINKKVQKGEDLGDLEGVDEVFERVLVEVYPEQEGGEGDRFAEKVFLEINKAEPVKLIDMPGVASAADRKIITEAVETLNENFPSMFSPSQRCRIPNVNVDNLRGAVYGANILKRHKLTTGKQLVEWFVEKNAELGEEYENSKEKQGLVSAKQWSKASSNNFYLGIDSSWLYK